jgi:hypothetical protein
MAYMQTPTGTPSSRISPNTNRVCIAQHLGALGTLPYRQVWNLYLVASIHNSKLFAKQLTSALEGTHIVCFNGKTSSHSTIKLHVGLVAPEGAGSYRDLDRFQAQIKPKAAL